MRVDELIIEVRDPNFARIGQIRPRDLVGSKFLLRHNNVGSWEITLPYNHPLGELLRLPGYGIVVTGPNNEVILSGPTLAAKLEQTQDNFDGNWLITGADDSLLLAERLAFPTPATDDLTAQTSAYDIRSGVAETVLKGYVNANLGPAAPAARRVPNLVLEPNLGRGASVLGRARFNEVQQLLFNLAQTGELGYRIVQKGSNLEFQVYVPQDLSGLIRLDLQNQRLSRAEYVYSSAKLTRAIVAGKGEAENRILTEVSNTESLAAETLWGRRIEKFRDARYVEELAGLEQRGLEALVDEGKTINEFSVTPSDDISMRFGIDWNLGDKVTVVTHDLEGVAVVTEIGISIDADGVRIGATIGTPVGVDFQSRLIAKTDKIDQRVNELERSVTGYGVNTEYQPEGGTDGTQPTFSGPAIFGSFNRFGNLVRFDIFVEFDNITSFGTGQYFLTLPYDSRTEVKFADGCLHEAATGRQYQMRGSVLAGSNVVTLWTTGIVGQRVFDEPFTATDPFTLTTADYFHISGTYEIESN
jgi:hypothetical protein